jgi:hypothetical protein
MLSPTQRPKPSMYMLLKFSWMAAGHSQLATVRCTNILDVQMLYDHSWGWQLPLLLLLWL